MPRLLRLRITLLPYITSRPWITLLLLIMSRLRVAGRGNCKPRVR